MNFENASFGHDTQEPRSPFSGYSTDVAVFPGAPASKAVIERERTRRALIDLVRRFSVEGLSWSASATVKISEGTAQAAKAFLLALPGNAALPKIAPDGEGGLSMIWERGGGRPLLAIIDGWRIHLVVDAATAKAKYFDDVPFDGEQIPLEVSKNVPKQ